MLALVAAFPIVLLIGWLVGDRRDRGAMESGKIGRLGVALRLVVVAAMIAALLWFGRDALRSGIDLVDTDRPPSIAVLPFTDMSVEGDQRYFAHGLSEEILNLLAGIDELKVSGRTSSFSFEGKDASIPEIGEALEVAHVLEGSVRKSGDQIRVTAQLIAAADGFHVWSRNFDRELTDVFVIQDEIAEAIASKLRLSLVELPDSAADASGTSSIEAYEEFLRARQLIQQRSVAGIESAREQLERALDLDPEFAPALAQSALAWLMLSDARTTPGSEPLATALSRAEALLDRALELEPRLASAWAVRGLLLTIEREFERAETALARALELNPSHSDALNWRAINLRNAGRLRDELRVRERLLEIDPLNLSNLFNLSAAYLLSGQVDRSLSAAQRLKRQFPESPWGDLAEVEALAGSGRLAEAHEIARDRLEDGNSVLVSSASGINLQLARFDRAMEVAGGPIGTALAGLGRFDEAVSSAREFAASAPGDSTSAIGLLNVLSLTGRHERLLDYYRTRWGGLEALASYFDFEDGAAEMLPIAAAQSVLGRDDALAASLSAWQRRLAGPRAHGYAMPWFRYTEAGFEALSGRRERALELLEEAIEGGYLTPFVHRAAQFHRLRDDAEFQRLVDRNFVRINEERAELGLPPISAEDIAAGSE